MANQGGLFNPQQQFPVTWPAEPTVSLAYLDQWLRAHPEQHHTLEALYETLHTAATILKNKRQDSALAASLADWDNAPQISTATALRESLRAVSRRLSVGLPSRLIIQSAQQEY